MSKKKTFLSTVMPEGFVGRGIKDKELYLERQSVEALKVMRRKPYDCNYNLGGNKYVAYS